MYLLNIYAPSRALCIGVVAATVRDEAATVEPLIRRLRPIEIKTLCPWPFNPRCLNVPERGPLYTIQALPPSPDTGISPGPSKSA